MRPVARVVLMITALSSILTFAVRPGLADEGMKISPTRDLALPTSWAGQWHITTTYRRASGTVWAVDDIIGVIRANEPLGLSALARGGLAECSGTVTDDRLAASCSRRVGDDACHVTLVAAIALERDGHALEGAGTTTTSVVGNCGDLPGGSTHTTFELVGTRLSTDQGPPGQSLPPLLTRFITSVPLLTLALTLPQVRPVIEDDCKGGAWRAFTAPVFHNQGQCIKFVHEQVRQ